MQIRMTQTMYTAVGKLVADGVYMLDRLTALALISGGYAERCEGGN